MKRIMILSVAVLFLVAGFNCKKEKKEPTALQSGLVNFITGDVKLIQKDGKESPAKIGDEIKQGMKIKTTGPKSIAEVYFGENAVKVLGNTVVLVESLLVHLNSGASESTFYVEKGQFFSKVGKKLAKGDIYSVRTKTTTAGVRGTDFLISEDEGKGNVAVLDGSVEVKNNTKSDAKPVVVEQKEEVDVLPGKDLVKKQLSEDKVRALNILLEIHAMREEIWNKMREQREEIRKAVEDQRQVNKEMLEKQREGDKARVAEQKAKDREMIDQVKDSTNQKGEEAKDKAKSQMDEVKDAAQKQKDSMKPQIEKMKINKDQFKTK